MHWPSYVAGLLTLPALLLVYVIGGAVRQSWHNPQARTGWQALAFLLALLVVVFLFGLNAATWLKAWGG